MNEKTFIVFGPIESFTSRKEAQDYISSKVEIGVEHHFEVKRYDDSEIPKNVEIDPVDYNA